MNNCSVDVSAIKNTQNQQKYLNISIFVRKYLPQVWCRASARNFNRSFILQDFFFTLGTPVFRNTWEYYSIFYQHVINFTKNRNPSQVFFKEFCYNCRTVKNIEKRVLMAASGNNFILEIFLNGCFSKTAGKIYLCQKFKVTNILHFLL